MIINSANMATIQTGFNAAFQAGIGSANKQSNKFATTVKSNTSITEYPMLMDFARLSEWVGQRDVKNLDFKALDIKNRLFQDSVQVPRTSVEDDNYGVFTPMFTELGRASEELAEQLAFEALTSQTALWADGVAFYSASRKFGKNTIANKGTSALTAANYGTTRTTMMSYLGASNTPLGIIPDILIVGPALEGTAKIILNNEKIDVSGTDQANPWRGTATLIVSPYVSGNHWFLACGNRAIKPVFIQERIKGDVLERKDTAQDENVFQNDTFVYGVRARGAAFCSMPPLVYGQFAS